MHRNVGSCEGLSRESSDSEEEQQSQAEVEMAVWFLGFSCTHVDWEILGSSAPREFPFPLLYSPLIIRLRGFQWVILHLLLSCPMLDTFSHTLKFMTRMSFSMPWTLAVHSTYIHHASNSCLWQPWHIPGPTGWNVVSRSSWKRWCHLLWRIVFTSLSPQVVIVFGESLLKPPLYHSLEHSHGYSPQTHKVADSWVAQRALLFWAALTEGWGLRGGWKNWHYWLWLLKCRHQ